MSLTATVYRWQSPVGGAVHTPVRVGVLMYQPRRWVFEYDPAYLQLGDDAWELDPIGIRSKKRSPYVFLGESPPPVFCDIALSGWCLDAVETGRSESSVPLDWWERLVQAPANGFGALFVGDIESKPTLAAVLLRALEDETASALDAATMKIESAMGGERPKVAVSFRGALGEIRHAIIKFAQRGERQDSVIAEATALTLAAELGLRVPAHEVRLNGSVPALCIERFDRSAGFVQHCVSAATALGISPGTDPEDKRRSYLTLASRLPGVDRTELFRRVVLNAVVGNTDDHPWNTSLVQVGLGQWQLSPLYDVMPFFKRQGVPVARMGLLATGEKSAELSVLERAGGEIAGLTRAEASRTIQEIRDHVLGRWRPIFNQHCDAMGRSTADEWRLVFEHPLSSR